MTARSAKYLNIVDICYQLLKDVGRGYQTEQEMYV